jgi:hypothetical protein
MKYNITIDDINNLNFNENFKNIINETDDEFYSVPGKEHYKLLSYFSTLFNNSTIINIVTHPGHSAVALSYNKSNTVYTIDNINNKDFFDNWKEIILSSPFIFLDLISSNGLIEYEFINYIKKIGYSGFIICDDIYYFKEIRNNFWYKIEDKYKYDLTNIGHWTGTGIITFNENIIFNKYTNDNWTLVTAYFNLTKYFDSTKEINERDQNYYFSHSISTLSLPYNLVIYCDKDSIEIIKNIRPPYLNDKTHYVIYNFDDFRFKKNGEYLIENFNDYRIKIIENRKKIPSADNRNTASYYLFCMSRYIMLKEMIELNPFNSTHFGWINFCIERMGINNVIHLSEALSVNRDKFSTCYIDYIPESMINNLNEYFKWGRCSMCSGFFTGNKEYMYKVCDLIENQFLTYLESGYGHADEQLYSPVYFENKTLFEHYYGDYQQMITNYKYIYDSPEPPIYNFIRNSFQNNNYIKCYEACKFVLNSYILQKCNINDNWLNELNNYYMKCKIILKDVN